MNQMTFSALAAISLSAGLAGAATVNVDFNGNPTGGDVNHVGDDGVFSTPGGTLWNGIAPPADAFDIPDEFGVPTTIDVIAGNAGGGTDTVANDLQDSGTDGPFSITGLDPSVVYTMAVYTGTNGGFGFTDANGERFFFFADPDADGPSLPGSEVINNTGDYFIVDNIIPRDLGNGDFGVDFGLDGIVTGLQIVPSPGAVALLGLGGLAATRRRRG
jgi:hypothetical protein